MPPIADEFASLGAGLFRWEVYDPACKADLAAVALVSAPGRLTLVDPVGLPPDARTELLRAAWAEHEASDDRVRHEDLAGILPGPAAILLTNANHARAADRWARTYRTPVYAAPAAIAELGRDGLTVNFPLPAGGGPLPGTFSPGPFETIPLPGFGIGETAFYHPADGGTMLVGDALLNLPAPYGFTLLPDKYCQDPRRARVSVERLLDFEFVRLTFAHGEPILRSAREQLRAMLALPAR